MKNKQILITVVVGLIGLGVGFFGGTWYQQSRRQAFTQQFAGARGMGNNFRNGTRPVNGEIITADDKSITVKAQDGSSKIVLFSDKTDINKSATGSRSDLISGTRVAVFGTENSDGTVTAQNIQINPIFRNAAGSPRPQ
jgi:hypothetical protein